MMMKEIPTVVTNRKNGSGFALIAVTISILVMSIAAATLLRDESNSKNKARLNKSDQLLKIRSVSGAKKLARVLEQITAGCLLPQNEEPLMLAECPDGSISYPIEPTEQEYYQGVECIGEGGQMNFQSQCTRNKERLPKFFRFTYNVKEGKRISSTEVEVSFDRAKLYQYAAIFTNYPDLEFNIGHGVFAGMFGLYFSDEAIAQGAQQSETETLPRINFMGLEETRFEKLFVTNLPKQNINYDSNDCQNNPDVCPGHLYVAPDAIHIPEFERGVAYAAARASLQNLEANYYHLSQNADYKGNSNINVSRSRIAMRKQHDGTCYVRAEESITPQNWQFQGASNYGP